MVYPEKDIKRVLKKLREGSIPPEYTGIKTKCIEFHGCTNSKGYGMAKLGGVSRYVHRAMKELVLGRRLETHEFVMHGCDNRICCNPDHTRVGTVVENNKDKDDKGRGNKGRTRLKREVVLDIKMRLKMGQGYTRIANDLGIYWRTVKAIRDGYSWKSVKLPEREDRAWDAYHQKFASPQGLEEEPPSVDPFAEEDGLPEYDPFADE